MKDCIFWVINLNRFQTKEIQEINVKLGGGGEEEKGIHQNQNMRNNRVLEGPLIFNCIVDA